MALLIFSSCCTFGWGGWEVYYSCTCNNLQSMSVGDGEMEILEKRTRGKGASALFTIRVMSRELPSPRDSGISG